MSSKLPRKSPFIWKLKTDLKCFYQCFPLFLCEYTESWKVFVCKVVDLDTFRLIFLGCRPGTFYSYWGFPPPRKFLPLPLKKKTKKKHFFFLLILKKHQFVGFFSGKNIFVNGDEGPFFLWIHSFL